MFDAPKAKLQITINKHKTINVHWKTSFQRLSMIIILSVSNIHLWSVWCVNKGHMLVSFCLYCENIYSKVRIFVSSVVFAWWCKRHFQQKFSYIVAVSFIGVGVLGEYHEPVASHWQTLSHNVVLSTSRHSNSQH